MSCSLAKCGFGKSKQIINTETTPIKRRSVKRKSVKRRSVKRKSVKRKSVKRKSVKRKSVKRRSRRNFGFKVLRNDQIIEMINSNTVYNNKACA